MFCGCKKILKERVKIIRKMKELSPIFCNDAAESISLECFCDKNDRLTKIEEEDREEYFYYNYNGNQTSLQKIVKETAEGLPSVEGKRRYTQ